MIMPTFGTVATPVMIGYDDDAVKESASKYAAGDTVTVGVPIWKTGSELFLSCPGCVAVVVETDEVLGGVLADFL